MVNHFVIIRELGRGVHGKVKLGRDIETGEEWVPSGLGFISNPTRPSKSWTRTPRNDSRVNYLRHIVSNSKAK